MNDSSPLRRKGTLTTLRAKLCNNQAWRPVPESEAKEGESVPTRFLQRSKPTKEGKKANARVILQGFRHKDVLEKKLETESKAQTLQNDQVLRNVLMLKTPRQPGLNVGSSTVNTDSNVPDFEWQRWSRLKMEVQNERAQQGWRKWCKELETGDGDMDASTRSVLTSESFTTNRWIKLTELVQLGTTEEFTDDQIKQWHRMWNDNLMFLGSVNKTINKQRRELELLQGIEKIS